MKKLLLVLGVGMLMSFSLNSCSKCASCSVDTGFYGDAEYCKGNNLEDAVYESAKADCNAQGGSFE